MRDLDFAVKEILSSEETFVEKIQEFRPKECVHPAQKIESGADLKILFDDYLIRGPQDDMLKFSSQYVQPFSRAPDLVF